MSCGRAAPTWADARRADWEAVSEDGELLCPDCLGGLAPRAIDSEAMQLAAEALGSHARDRWQGDALEVADW